MPKRTPQREPSAVARRIEQKMAEAKLYPAEIERRAGLAKGSLGRILSGERQTPRGSTLEAIADALGTSVDDLLGRPIRLPDETKNVVGYEADIYGPGAKRLPVYLWGTAGDPTSLEDAPMPDRVEYPPGGKEPMIGPRGFGVVVRGSSMTDYDIHDGDTVWVNPLAPVRYGMAVLAHITDGQGEQGMVVKEYTRVGDRDCLRSAGENGASPVICEQFKIIGPVVWVVRGHAPRRGRSLRSA